MVKSGGAALCLFGCQVVIVTLHPGGGVLLHLVAAVRVDIQRKTGGIVAQQVPAVLPEYLGIQFTEQNEDCIQRLACHHAGTSVSLSTASATLPQWQQISEMHLHLL